MPSSWLPAVPYQERQQGFWHPITSTLNWCEEDYYATPYIAEVVNTVTNVLFIYLGLKGVLNCRKHGHDTIFQITYLGYMIVGIGSFLFHATLKYPMQLVDELSMIYTTCLMAWATFSHLRSKEFAVWLGASLVGLAAFVSLYYHYLQDPVFHQNVYAVLTAIVVFRSMYVMEAGLRPSMRTRSRAADEPSESEEKLVRSNDIRNQHILRTMWWMIGYGLSIFLGGFLVWTMDNEFCGTIRRWRHVIGLPWGILLEGHGWWHIMTGTGAYFYVTWGIWLRHCLNGRQDEFRLVWPSVWSFPEVVRSNNTEKSIRDQRNCEKKFL